MCSREEYVKQYNKERKVQGYLNPKNLKLFKAYTQREGLGDSEAINEMIKSFFQQMPSANRALYADK